jgi:hypothetical protein
MNSYSSHIRFFPLPHSDPNRGNLLDYNSNAVPGTVVDTDITTPDPKVFDFYMQSRKSPSFSSLPS